MNQQAAQYQDWIGKTENSQSVLTSYPMVAMAATLDREPGQFNSGDEIPPLWHWLYFLETSKHSRMAVDGHSKKGDFLPPVDLPRRMWAGSRISFLQALHVGDSVERISRIKDVTLKQGRSGQLAFVCVEHKISSDNGLALIEEHDIVYRDNPPPVTEGNLPTPSPAPANADFSRIVKPDPVLLFRYSALTFNAHRIHYDREFATGQESYPGLVVHGPLLATLMLDLLITSIPQIKIKLFEFKALHPVFDLQPFKLCCNVPDSDGETSLWVQDTDGALCMKATALLRDF